MPRVVFGLAAVLALAACQPERAGGGGTVSRASTPALDGLNLPAVPYNYAHPALPAFLNQAATPPRRGGPPGGGRGAPGRGPGLTTRATDTARLANPVTDAGATLGRVLFYDRSLSADGRVACATCHQQARGFADPAPFSTGVGRTVTRRNAMSLANVRYNPSNRYFWDERVAGLEAQVLMPIADPGEIGRPLDELIAVVASRAYYPPLFEAAFGDTRITRDRIARALAQFLRSMVSFNARYDAGRAGVRDALAPFANFTAEENRGKRIFFRGVPGDGQIPCARCHATDAFTGRDPERGSRSSASNNGVRDPGEADRGRAEVTRATSDTGHFRPPSLRNIAVTGPYMHDGRFATLEAVINHYDSSISDAPGLSRGLRPGGYRFSASERAALVAFLKTLTDQAFLADPKFSDPFIR